jgi:hypothetical protein
MTRHTDAYLPGERELIDLRRELLARGLLQVIGNAVIEDVSHVHEPRVQRCSMTSGTPRSRTTSHHNGCSM